MNHNYIKIDKGIRKSGNTYEFNVSCGYDGNGKHIRKYTTFTPPEGVSEAKADKLAKAAYQEFVKKAEGNKAYNANMKFNDLCDLYFREYAPNKLKKTTIEHYKSCCKNHLKPTFGNMKLKEITTASISEFLTGLDCKPLTARKFKIVFHSIMKYALTQKIISENPVVGSIWKEDVECDYGEIENFLNVAEAKKVLTLLEDYSIFNTIIKLLIYTGMRSGECLGLRWSSIDFENKSIFINKTLSYAENQWFLSPPKTPKSIRNIYVGDDVIEMLKKHKEEQDKQKEIVGEAWQQPEMVFTSCTGHWYDRSLLNKQFKTFIKQNNKVLNIEHNITPHGLRHTNASLLLVAGEDVENVAKHLGHSSSDITSRVYSHILAETKVRIAKTIADTLS